MSVSTVFSFCVSLFNLVLLLFSPQDSFYKFTMSVSISLQPARNIAEIKKHLIVYEERKKCCVRTKPNALI